MTPLPAVPGVLRVRLLSEEYPGYQAGFRFFLEYTGGPPANSDLDALATSVASHWNTEFASFTTTNAALTSVLVEDLSSTSGASGEWTGTDTGTDSNAPLPVEACAVLNFKIGRRYRGGKPKSFLPIGTTVSLSTTHTFTTGFRNAVDAAWTAFMGALLGSTFGSTLLVNHVSISYYEGFDAVQNPVTLRYRNIPRKRTTPLIDQITGHETASFVGSQRRRTRELTS